MTWRRRLLELACAGGAITTLTGCPVFACGNANPDPCICDRTPEDSKQCVAEKACRDNNGTWDFFDGSVSATDAGDALYGHCEGYPHDAGADAVSDVSVLPDAATD